MLGCRTLILAVEPDALEIPDPVDHLIAYGYDPSYKHLVCAVMIFKSHINLMLAKGATLPDPDGLLEGTGKSARHIRINQAADLAVPGVKILLTAAYNLDR